MGPLDSPRPHFGGLILRFLEPSTSYCGRLDVCTEWPYASVFKLRKKISMILWEKKRSHTATLPRMQMATRVRQWLQKTQISTPLREWQELFLGPLDSSRPHFGGLVLRFLKPSTSYCGRLDVCTEWPYVSVFKLRKKISLILCEKNTRIRPLCRACEWPLKSGNG